MLGVSSRLPRAASLQAFSEYRETEARNSTKCLVSHGGEILEYETLELRIHPPNVNVDNNAHPTRTVITIDSANRPGTLVEVVQHLTELGLRIHKSRISSDGGWFVDLFEVSELVGTNEAKVRDQRKLNSIAGMLSVNAPDDDVYNADETDEWDKIETTVFELAGVDHHGLLADVTQLLTSNGCDVRSAAVWTHQNRVAFVVSVTEKGKAVADAYKLGRLQQLLRGMMDALGSGFVNIHKVKGEIHHERRLHRLLLREESQDLERRLQSGGDASLGSRCNSSGALSANGSEHSGASGSGSDASAAAAAAQLQRLSPVAEAADACEAHDGAAAAAAAREQPPLQAALPNGAVHAAAAPGGGAVAAHGGVAPPNTAAAAPAPAGPQEGGESGAAGLLSDPLAQYRSPKHSKPEVDITFCNMTGYWLITIKCKDRSKLLFDTVCTLADLDYDVFHATIDSERGLAFQEYYCRPRLARHSWDADKAERLKSMLESSIQRRFPKGLKVHVHSVDRFGCLAAVTRVLKANGLTVTRAKVKTFAANNSSGHTFYVMDAGGGPPDRSRVEDACTQIGGRLVEAGEEERAVASSCGSHKFSFSFLHRQWAKGWGGSPGSSGSASQ